jgi:hypothetical protein
LPALRIAEETVPVSLGFAIGGSAGWPLFPPFGYRFAHRRRHPFFYEYMYEFLRPILRDERGLRVHIDESRRGSGDVRETCHRFRGNANRGGQGISESRQETA